jgi:Queuosine salvage protein
MITDNVERNLAASVSENTKDAIGKVKDLWYASGIQKRRGSRMFEVLETVKHVVDKSRHVQIDREALKNFSHDLAARGIPAPTWDADHHFKGNDEETVAYLLVVDAVNFCFWPPAGKQKWEISYKGRRYSGYYGLAASIKKALGSQIPLTEASFLASLTLEHLQEVFAGTGVLQLEEQRLRNLQEMGRVLLDKYRGRTSELVAAAEGSALKLVRTLAADFSSFSDRAIYHGQRIFFYKRAQLFASDLHGAFGGKGLGSFCDVEELTAFADYKLPQVLRHVGALIYSQGLAEKVNLMMPLEPGSEEEIEIRANTVWAVELICQEMKRLGKEVHASEIDWVLWNLGQDDRFRAKPYHRTVTTFY